MSRQPAPALRIRLERPSDYDAAEKLTYAAFQTMHLPGRARTNEHFLLHLLRQDPAFIPELDLVAECDGALVAQIVYSHCQVLRPDGSATEAVVFGPVSVLPALHRQGIGSRLIRASLRRAKRLGYKAVLITGHPAYYPRFGFVPASRYDLTFLDGASPDAFMALELQPGSLGTAGGKWQCCPAFDTAESDIPALDSYHQAFLETIN